MERHCFVLMSATGYGGLLKVVKIKHHLWIQASCWSLALIKLFQAHILAPLSTFLLPPPPTNARMHTLPNLLHVFCKKGRQEDFRE